MGELAIEFASKEAAEAFLDAHPEFVLAPYGHLVEALYPAHPDKRADQDDDNDERMR
jgi:hypothetical protein